MQLNLGKTCPRNYDFYFIQAAVDKNADPRDKRRYLAGQLCGKVRIHISRTFPGKDEAQCIDTERDRRLGVPLPGDAAHFYSDSHRFAVFYLSASERAQHGAVLSGSHQTLANQGGAYIIVTQPG